MMTVHEVSARTGVSIRTLRYYDRIGLLPPTEHTDAGYRLYDDAALDTLKQILLYRELEFSLKDIRKILQSPSFDRKKALDQQIRLLQMKKEHLGKLIDLAREMQKTGANQEMDLSAFDKSRIDEYAAEAKAAWGDTPEYQEYERRTEGMRPNDRESLTERFMNLFVKFGKIRSGDPASGDARKLVQELQKFISEHYYPCSDLILANLGRMYASDASFAANIDTAGGEGTAKFASEAIRLYCEK